jgi:hypothetical protein
MTNDQTRSELRRLKDQIAELKQAIWDINDKLKAVAAVTGGPPRPPKTEVPIRQKPYAPSCEHSDCSRSR